MGFEIVNPWWFALNDMQLNSICNALRSIMIMIIIKIINLVGGLFQSSGRFAQSRGRFAQSVGGLLNIS